MRTKNEPTLEQLASTYQRLVHNLGLTEQQAGDEMMRRYPNHWGRLTNVPGRGHEDNSWLKGWQANYLGPLTVT